MAVSPLSISDEDILKDEPQKLLSPSNPTPEETIFLSNIDLAVAFTVETVYFFEDGSAAEMSRIVKRALAILLVPYYFLAGRFQTNRESGRLELACNNAGVLFVNAKSKVRMKDLGDLSLPNPSFGRFVHRPGLNTNLHERALFTVQVTEFVCGGYAIGMVTNHGVLDGKAAAEMFQNLASICRGGGGCGDLKTQTIFNDRTIFRARNPPLISHPHQEYTPFSPTLKQLPSSAFTALTKPSPSPSSPMSAANHRHCLIPFTPSTIATLKNAAAPIPCSTFEAILSQLWRARTRAVYSDCPGETSMVLFAVDVRSKIRPVLPDGFVGNAVVTGFAAARAAEVVERPFSFCVERVKEGIERVSEEEYVRSAIDWLEVYRGIPATCNGKSFYVSAWWKLPFKELDFGFGKPVHVGPVANGNDEFVLLLSPGNGGESGGGKSRSSVNVWMSLEKEKMKKLMRYIFTI
ncbi:hypothetical protein IC582_012829 [Cucumis melo]|uniref:Omega-hydroxypalmitate O-feruloyl transferase-like n=1 Tax=Cucumis melo TaxID=3656 RepID=A0A1S3AY24_CUCME|nr:acyltransferase GLAUCE-like [Cucumis melo]